MLVYNKIEVDKLFEGHNSNTILYYFPDKFLPNTIFNHVLIRTTKWCVAEGHRIRRVSYGIGVFDFSNNTQSFALECCSSIYCIKCHISVHKQAANDKNLWLQRKELIMRLNKIIADVHKCYIGKAREPIAYIDCPLHHDQQCTPHIRFSHMMTSRSARCAKLNQPISEDTYNLLLEPTNQSQADVAVAAQVGKGAAIVIPEIRNKDTTPTPKELNRYVIHKYAANWERIGIELGLKRKILNIISKDHLISGCETCFQTNS